MNLRGSIKVNGSPMSAAVLDAFTRLDPDAAPVEVVAVLESVRATADLLVAAGLHGQLALADLSAYEIACIAAARADESRRHRETLAGLIGLVVGRLDSGFEMLPEDEQIAHMKWVASLARRSQQAVNGGG